MALEAALRASADAINELRESLEEESLTTIAVEATEGGALAHFAVRGEDGSVTAYTATFSGSSLPAPCVLVAAGRAAPRGLGRANSRLAGGASLAKVVAAAGRAAGLDLDWTAEAEGDGERQGWAAQGGAHQAPAVSPPPPPLQPPCRLAAHPNCRRQR